MTGPTTPGPADPLTAATYAGPPIAVDARPASTYTTCARCVHGIVPGQRVASLVPDGELVHVGCCA
jgi:hypothetical protein